MFKKTVFQAKECSFSQKFVCLLHSKLPQPILKSIKQNQAESRTPINKFFKTSVLLHSVIQSCCLTPKNTYLKEGVVVQLTSTLKWFIKKIEQKTDKLSWFLRGGQLQYSFPFKRRSLYEQRNAVRMETLLVQLVSKLRRLL